MAQHVRRSGTSRPSHARGWVIAAAVFAAVTVLAFTGYFAYRAQASLPGTKLPDLGNRHVQTVETPHEPYNSDPPTSGPHLPYIAPWGEHTRPIPRELQVHNLEDGGVLIQYNCECPDLVAELRRAVQTYDTQVILAPYPTMKTRIALTAWTRIDTMDRFDGSRIQRFIESYRGIDHHER